MAVNTGTVFRVVLTVHTYGGWRVSLTVHSIPHWPLPAVRDLTRE
jgi:hypothetical protein